MPFFTMSLQFSDVCITLFLSFFLACDYSKHFFSTGALRTKAQRSFANMGSASLNYELSHAHKIETQ